MSADLIERVLEQADALALSHANLGYFDVTGVFRSKRYAVRHLKKAMTEGIAWIALPSGMSPADDGIFANRWIDPGAGYSDGVIRLDPDSARAMPFDSGGEGLLLVGEFTGPIAGHCPRALLRAELERLAALGFDLFGAFELEGAVLAESAESLREKRAADVAVVPGWDRVYSLVDQTGQAGFIDDLLACCETMGMPLDTAHAEFTHILEVGMAPTTGLRIADNAGLYKAAAKIVAARHNAYVSFMARRSETDQGSGAHINVSLKDRASGEGVFFDADAEYRLTGTARHFIGGLLTYLPELFLLLAPNLNSYKRFAPGIFTPLNNSWSINNRTVALRVSNETAGATRVEVRPAGADVCPHLALLAVCLAGRLGIEEKIEPPAPLTGNGWAETDTGASPFPLEFGAAIEAFAVSAVAKTHIGDGFVADFVTDRKWQQETFAATVTDWEIRTFSSL